MISVPPIEAPTSLPEFIRTFPDEETCERFLFGLRWPEGFVCPKCNNKRVYSLARGVYECGNRHQTSITAGTAMHRSKLPLTTWFYAAYLVSTLTPGISALQFQKQLGITRYETAFQMLHKLRSALVAPDRERLKGEVEIDEAFIGGPEEGRPGRGSEDKALVVVAVEVQRWFDTSGNKGQRGHERGSLPWGPPLEVEHDGQKGVWRKRAGRVRMNVIPDASAETLLPWVQANVEEGSTVYTDGWSAYNGLGKLGYKHEKVLQSSHGENTGRYLPMIHLLISNVKRWLTGTHKGAVQKKHLPAYLNEFTFRFNRRFWRGPAFTRALGLAMHAESWPEYDTLYSVGDEGGWVHPNPDRSREIGQEIRAKLAAIVPPDVARWMTDNEERVEELIVEVLRNLLRERQS